MFGRLLAYLVQAYGWDKFAKAVPQQQRSKAWFSFYMEDALYDEQSRSCLPERFLAEADRLEVTREILSTYQRIDPEEARELLLDYIKGRLEYASDEDLMEWTVNQED